jgi:hypothetical protein
MAARFSAPAADSLENWTLKGCNNDFCECKPARNRLLTYVAFRTIPPIAAGFEEDSSS